jgi:soluble lytic murein transglycosylase-like protein
MRRRERRRSRPDRWFVPALIVCNDCGFYARAVSARVVSRWHVGLIVLFALLAASGKLTADRLYERSEAPQAAAVRPVPRALPQRAHVRAPYGALIERAAVRHGLDPALVRAVVAQESGYDAKARSGRGAVGLMQLMPATARAMGVRRLDDPRQALDGGSRYLRQLLDRYDGDLFRALAAYNVGPSALAANAPAPAETERFVQEVLRRYAAFRQRDSS